LVESQSWKFLLEIFLETSIKFLKLCILGSHLLHHLTRITNRCKIMTYYGTESARCFRERSAFVSMIPQLLWACFLLCGKAQGSKLLPKRVAHERSEGVLPFKVAAGDREPSHIAKSRPKTRGGAYPDKW
jgi:hypothetical protein